MLARRIKEGHCSAKEDGNAAKRLERLGVVLKRSG